MMSKIFSLLAFQQPGFNIDINILAPIIVSTIGIIAAYIAAMRAAQQTAKLSADFSEKAAIEREKREQEKQQKQLEEQKHSLRQLLSLEIERNRKDLAWLDKYLNEIEEITEKQRFVTLHMPSWSQRAWYGQNSSHLLPIALTPQEITKISFFHSELERLAQYKNLLADFISHDSETLTDLPNQKNQISEIWNFFEDTRNRVSDSVNQLQLDANKNMTIFDVDDKSNSILTASNTGSSLESS